MSRVCNIFTHQERSLAAVILVIPKTETGQVTCGDLNLERKKWHLLSPLEPQKDVLGLRGSHPENDRTSYLHG